MIDGKLTVEGQREMWMLLMDEVKQALLAMSQPNGPTFIVVEDEEGNYVQAAGSNGSYFIESRDVFGEGFIHWRATRPQAASGGTTKVFYIRKTDTEGKQSMSCSKELPVEDIYSFDDMSAALAHFAEYGERSPELAWRDVTEDFLKKEKPIRQISPRGDR